ncbi:flavin reductase family protein [Sphingomonas hengshuiensis]|uniref:Flavin reductase like domain-containing protein n=1 Tax=Sphingomonas hengshuiensis TaxID=1609977 RepID=A0A7U5BEG0_9SPHN|nr:flavin reductase family protein [Sphingomonas hengshuiensis]AJP70792.1 hypothetical protein TS85_01600 [Sphingomonas hengshuiensis]
MEFDLEALPQAARYKVMSSAITPRPIAWVTSCSAAGIRNAAPYSFFNMMGDSPPTVALGLLRREGDGHKDTATNILETGEFVINLVPEALAEAMNQTCADVPPEVDELAWAGIATLPSRSVAPPRIAGCPASFECVTLHALETGPGQLVVIGQVRVAHIDDAFVLDADRLHFDTPAMALIGRMHGRGWYARGTDLFQMDRPL